VIELGVSGGRGLFALGANAEDVSRALDIRISGQGLDAGNGMPASIDSRELLHVWVRAFAGWTKLGLEHL